jgi:hypothetical protein
MNERKFLITAFVSTTGLALVGGMAIGASWERGSAAQAAPVPTPQTSTSVIDTSVTPLEWQGVLVANSFSEAAAACETLTDSYDVSDCINSALVEWCEFVPFEPGDEFYDPEIDGRCLAEQAE